MPRLAVSSWSLDQTLREGLPLLDLPRELQQRGIPNLEICHFHLPTTDAAYLAELRQALRAAGITLYSFLIDTGDITTSDPTQREAELAMLRDWIDVAATLGATRVRIAAGRQPASPEVVARSVAGLRALADYAARRGLATSTENWLETSMDTDALVTILDECAGKVDLVADFGNAEATPDKYATIARLLPRATSAHFSIRLTDGAYDPEDERRALDLLRQSAFDGIITMIYGKKNAEWDHLAHLRAALQSVM